MPQILEALPLAVERGLRLPLVYNTSSYDSLDSLHLLDGMVDIYMPDFKFWDPALSLALCEGPGLSRGGAPEHEGNAPAGGRAQARRVRPGEARRAGASPGDARGDRRHGIDHAVSGAKRFHAIPTST